MRRVTRAHAAGEPTIVSQYPHVMSDVALPQTFADLIRTAREAKGWTQEQLEAATADNDGAHVSISTISRWERGLADRPDPEHVRRICAALGVDPRRAAVALGYLTAEEVEPGAALLDPEIEEVLRILPDVPEDERRKWIQYLKYLQQLHNQQKRGQKAG